MPVIKSNALLAEVLIFGLGTWETLPIIEVLITAFTALELIGASASLGCGGYEE